MHPPCSCVESGLGRAQLDGVQLHRPRGRGGRGAAEVLWPTFLATLSVTHVYALMLRVEQIFAGHEYSFGDRE